MDAIVARELVREYAPGRGACGMGLCVAEGECYGLLGRNGSGKSTLVRLVLGLERPDSGSLTVLGALVGEGSRRHLGRCGAALDTPALWPDLTGRQNAWFVCRSYGLSDEATETRLDDWFERADLAAVARERVSTWSFGMRRKLGLVQGMAHEPDLLVLDEPTAGVDAHFLVHLTEALRGRAERGATTLIASNDPDYLAGVATRVAFLDAGRIVAEGTVEELLAAVADRVEYRLALAGPVPVALPEDVPGLESFVQEGQEITAVGSYNATAIAVLVGWAVDSGASVRNLEIREPTLRDAFLTKTGKTVGP